MDHRCRHDTDRFASGYDRVGNRTYRDNLVASWFGEIYAYDELDRLKSRTRGTLNAEKTGIQIPFTFTVWSLDLNVVGNWNSLQTTAESGATTTQTRTHDSQNRITGVSGHVTPGYDASGNMGSASV